MAGSKAHQTRLRGEFSREALPHLDALYGAALHLTRNREEAQDLCQEAMLRAYRSFRQFTAGTNCRAWLLTILYNVFRKGYRRHQRERVAITQEGLARVAQGQEPLSAASYSPEQLLAETPMQPEVQAALENLPEEFRGTLMLVDGQELSYQEAAQVLAVPVGTVRSRLSRARGLMRQALAEFALQHGFKPPHSGQE
ncbi:MAG TPA: sigma-70 family RNA polymerase sigma factor [Candidatus Binataceae bacterium]|nr:sigma-70 family RNA polymerase sigma factor [Candidatus Binataceae bacterium]